VILIDWMALKGALLARGMTILEIVCMIVWGYLLVQLQRNRRG